MDKTFSVSMMLAEIRSTASAFAAMFGAPAHLRDDIAQDVAIRAFKWRERLVTLGHLERVQWVRRTTSWMVANERRSSQRRAERARQLHASCDRDIGCEVDEQVAWLDDLLQGLGSLDRALLIGRALHGYSAAELGERHGLTVHAVWNRLSRVRSFGQSWRLDGRFGVRADRW